MRRVLVLVRDSLLAHNSSMIRPWRRWSGPWPSVGSVGIANAVAGRYAEARVPLQRFLGHYPNFLHIHLTLAAVYSELGQAAEARAEAAEMLRLNP